MNTRIRTAPASVTVLLAVLGITASASAGAASE